MHPWQRNYLAVWPSLFATSMGIMAYLPVLALYVEERFGITDPIELAFWAGIIYGTAPFAAAVCGPIWGGLGDRLGKKPMAIRANLAIAATTALMPFAPTPGWLLLLRTIQGAFAGYVAPAMALVTHDAPRAVHGLCIARMQVWMAVGSFLGPVLGAEVAHWWGRAALFWVTSVLSTLASVQLWWFAREVPPAPTVRRPFVRELLAGCGQLLGNRAFAWLLALVLLLRLGQNMLEPFVALFVRDLGAWGPCVQVSATPELALDRTVAVAFAVLAVAQWICTPAWGRLADRHGPLRCLILLALVLGLLLAGTAVVASVDQFLLLRAVAACFMAGSMTLAYAAASKRVVSERRTLAFSLVQSCMQFGFALGPQIGSAVAAIGAADQRAHFRLPFVVAGGLCLLAAAGMWVLRRRSTTRSEPGEATLGQDQA
ncbi:MAG: MFS transporter [Planctomycetes bacterium]|nr:MFS transporter [Planctomycetota bacterium]